MPPGKTPLQHLTDLTWAGAARRYPDGVPAEIEKTILAELALIAKLEFERYFLTVHDVVAFARSRHILCQGRGSAANSVVCFCLGITEVNPAEIKVLFARFMSENRGEPPDIDVDFEHERREEVIQHIYEPLRTIIAPRSARPSSTTARGARSARSARCSASRPT